MNKKEVKSDKTKNIIIIALILIIIFGGSFLVSELKNTKKDSQEKENTIELDDLDVNDTAVDAQEEANKISDNEKKAHNPISVDEYLTLKEGKNKAIIYIARPTCNYCTISDPILQNIAFKNNITINYINTDEISDAESIDLINSDEYFKDGYGTPLLLIVKNNKIMDKYEGLTTSKEYTSFFKKNGVL